MKLKYTYSFQKYDEKYLAIVDFSETEKERRLLWVNECGKTIMEFLHNEMTKEELIRAITEKYCGDTTVIAAAVETFIGQLADADLLNM